MYQLLSDAVVPRPIALVSTIGPEGIPNVAPFSFFNAVCSSPPTIAFSVSRRRGELKDTLRNIQYGGEFVVNIVDDAIAEQMNATSADFPPEISEFQTTGLTPVASDLVGAPRVGEAPVSLECKLVQVVEIGQGPRRSALIIGEVVLFHVRDGLYLDGRIDPRRLKAVGRLSGNLYCRTWEIFEMVRPVYRPGP
ncbi:MAG: flavin reductase family protein [Chloroflexota bacterium]|nr:flavin reductase family protein [Chloroflexota bacterium]